MTTSAEVKATTATAKPSVVTVIVSIVSTQSTPYAPAPCLPVLYQCAAIYTLSYLREQRDASSEDDKEIGNRTGRVNPHGLRVGYRRVRVRVGLLLPV